MESYLWRFKKQKDIYKTFKIKNIISHSSCSKLFSRGKPKKMDEYYENNVVGTINLLDCIIKFKAKNLIFSSTCSVYGNKNSESKKMKF